LFLKKRCRNDVLLRRVGVATFFSRTQEIFVMSCGCGCAAVFSEVIDVDADALVGSAVCPIVVVDDAEVHSCSCLSARLRFAEPRKSSDRNVVQRSSQRRDRECDERSESEQRELQKSQHQCAPQQQQQQQQEQQQNQRQEQPSRVLSQEMNKVLSLVDNLLASIKEQETRTMSSPSPLPALRVPAKTLSCDDVPRSQSCERDDSVVCTGASAIVIDDDE
jgi:hypothetical protein